MSSYWNGYQEREWPEEDADWCDFCDYPKHDCLCSEEERIERAVEALKTVAPVLNVANNAGEFLSKVAEAAKAHYDTAQEPYPEHLRSLLSFLEPFECEKSGCGKAATVVTIYGDSQYLLCEHHSAIAIAEHDYLYVRRIGEQK